MSPLHWATTILLCCLALSLTSAKPNAYGPRRCCPKFRRKPLDCKINGIIIPDSACRLKAVIFRTPDGDVCADPKQRWVKTILEHLSLDLPDLSRHLEKHNLLDKAPASTTNSSALMDIQD